MTTNDTYYTYIDSDYQHGYVDIETGNLIIDTKSVIKYSYTEPCKFLKVQSDMGHLNNTNWELVEWDSLDAVYKPMEG